MQLQLEFMREEKLGDAIIDPTGKYRYLLWRKWNIRLPSVAFIMLNPSTADHTADDPTIRRCMGFAKQWGFGQVDVVNLFAYRATDPKVLTLCSDPIGNMNDEFIHKAAIDSELILLAWGTKGHLMNRDAEVLEFLGTRVAERVFCLTKTKDGFPMHPLYVSRDTRPVPFF